MCCKFIDSNFTELCLFIRILMHDLYSSNFDAQILKLNFYHSKFATQFLMLNFNLVAACVVLNRHCLFTYWFGISIPVFVSGWDFNFFNFKALFICFCCCCNVAFIFVKKFWKYSRRRLMWSRLMLSLA